MLHSSQIPNILHVFFLVPFFFLLKFYKFERLYGYYKQFFPILSYSLQYDFIKENSQLIF